jgi:hypothetical protein
MSHFEQFGYKGYDIIVRCTELDNQAAQAAKRFHASFTVNATAWDELPWQQFPKAVFESRPPAVANALAAAERSIDLNMVNSAAARRDGGRE